MATALFYASSTGNTADVAQEIASKLGNIPCIDIGDDGITSINEYDKVILGTPTWGEGELPDDWLDVWDEFTQIDFSNKTVALFGLGDQDGYGDYFLDGMGLIYEVLVKNNVKVIGEWGISDEYYHEDSMAVQGEKFVGLALDEDNQEELTPSRIELWCQEIKGDIL